MSDAKKILIIDDQPEIIEVIQELLEIECEDVETNATTNGQEGLDMIFTQKYSVICTDANMPNVSGLNIIKKTRTEDNPNIETPIIIITGDATVVSAGIKDYKNVQIINKTENIPVLIELISEKLNEES